jgi:DNA-binding transcriptional LysR family regulator
VDNRDVQTDRLQVLLQLSRLGSMRAVADELGTSTSTVSQQIAVLAREAGVALVEPDGRRVRLTPAGRRLAEHAVGILAAVEAARVDLGPGARPSGTVRAAGFATAIRRSLLPAVESLGRTHPGLRLVVAEHEPGEARALLHADEVDLALTYDYALAPAPPDPALDAAPLWSTPWGLAVPADAGDVSGDARTVVAAFRDAEWIVNSRNDADEVVVRALARTAGFDPAVTHRADSLDLVQDLVQAGLGVGLMPLHQPTVPGVRVLPLTEPDLVLRAFVLTRRGRGRWPPLAATLALLTTGG